MFILTFYTFGNCVYLAPFEVFQESPTEIFIKFLWNFKSGKPGMKYQKRRVNETKMDTDLYKYPLKNIWRMFNLQEFSVAKSVLLVLDLLDLEH